MTLPYTCLSTIKHIGGYYMFYKVVLVVAVLSLDLLTGSNFTNHSSSGIYTECFLHSFFIFIIHGGSALQDPLFVEIYYYQYYK